MMLVQVNLAYLDSDQIRFDSVRVRVDQRWAYRIIMAGISGSKMMLNMRVDDMSCMQGI